MLVALCTFLAVLPFPASADTKPTLSKADGIRYFETNIRPLFVTHCVECHGPKKQEGSLRLDTFAGMMNGGDSGPSIIPHEPKQSLLAIAVSYKNEELQMPPEKKLGPMDIKKIEQWIEYGVPHPDAGNGSAVPRKRINIEEGRRFWAFKPPVILDRPFVERADWPQTELDYYVLAKLEEKGLSPAPQADRLTLIRRATIDLTGLPPDPADVAAFLADHSEHAFAKVVDRLLNSPHYGERWGRHWLDVARYADSNGLDENVAHGNAWRYRDYVIKAFNSDKPFDQFVIEQIAGDLLPPTKNQSLHYERLIATGYLALGPKVLAEPDKEKMAMDIIDEQIDTLGRSFMGLTLGCSRCHDHKFDPINNEDYYALAGIFKSTKTMESYKTIARWWENPIPSDKDQQQAQEHQQKVAAAKAKIDEFIKATNAKILGASDGAIIPKDLETKYPKNAQDELKKLREALTAIEKGKPETSTAMGVSDGEITNVAVHIRGSHLTLGKVVPRRFPIVFFNESQSELSKTQSGRLELARWLTSKYHPLTARVFVNRVWRWHFGSGIVATPDNFGNLGARPTNQPLLDWLAVKFRQEGWSIKQLHRIIMNSATYQMSSQLNDANAAIDPENQFFWRANVRRLDAESLRDSILAVSGLLNKSMGGSLLHVKNREFFFNHTSKDDTDYSKPVRSVYLPVVRNNLYGVFQLFDYTDAGSVVGHRTTSTVAPQALFMMNSDFMQDASEALAKRIMRVSQKARIERPATNSTETKRNAVIAEQDKSRIAMLYRLTHSRPATQTEESKAIKFLSLIRAANQNSKSNEINEWSLLCQVLLSSNEFVFTQ